MFVLLQGNPSAGETRNPLSRDMKNINLTKFIATCLTLMFTMRRKLSYAKLVVFGNFNAEFTETD